ncbi:uncharacterized protein MONBRDRAFT_23412 [Monosiga brevicollis MX1]|uniref:Glycosyltransferase 61 catalytic domain-containing protein n=1 Tax=Monosiga brevicollis TaxID=81824 RepID=A9UTB6_MONBE|nr:uncharacterized protein MONBRDRAFT_23412 [Monosiga brevicollis MX1]EDQ91218.1 predicted protein [Monosiga brevicollis MX1]|eukprot:XP_001743640.1 hypothetical protein [Monosiga brevicollis MX1]
MSCLLGVLALAVVGVEPLAWPTTAFLPSQVTATRTTRELLVIDEPHRLAGYHGFVRDTRNSQLPLPHGGVVVRSWQQPEYVTAPIITDGCIATDRGLTYNASVLVANTRWHRRDAAPLSQVALQFHEHECTLFNFAIVWGEEFQHFMLEVLPRIASVWSLIQDTPRACLVLNSGPGARILHELLGVPAERIVVAHANSVHCGAQIVFPDFEQQRKIGLLPPEAYRPIQPLISAWLDSHRSTSANMTEPHQVPHLLLYLRRAAGTDRAVQVEQEQALLAQIEARMRPGYQLEVWEPEGPHGWHVDGPLFGQAALVFGPHGGAFANLPFAPRATRVLEFIAARHSEPQLPPAVPKLDIRPCYWSMATALGQEYWQSEPLKFDFSQPDMLVNVTDILNSMELMGFLA